jgi:hypothetical protein
MYLSSNPLLKRRNLTGLSKLLILMVWLVPESHIYYARKGEGDKAKKSMLTLYGNIDGYDVVSAFS